MPPSIILVPVTIVQPSESARDLIRELSARWPLRQIDRDSWVAQVSGVGTGSEAHAAVERRLDESRPEWRQHLAVWLPLT